MKNKSIYVLLGNVLLFATYTIICFLFDYLNFFPLTFLKYSVVIISLLSVLIGKQYFKWFHSYLLFLITFILFICSRIYLDILKFEDLASTSLYIYYHISDKTLSKSLFLVIISLLSVNIGFYYSFHKEKRKNVRIYKELDKPQYPKLLKQIVIILLIATLPGTLLKLWSDFQFVRVNGYLSIFSDFQSAPLPYRLSWFLFGLIFPLILLFKNDKKTTIFWLIIMVIISLFDALKGSRNSLIRPILYFGWFYYTFYSKADLKLFKIALYFIVFVYVSELFVIYRLGSSIDDLGIRNIIMSLFYTQGVTFTIIPIYLDHQDIIVNPSRFYVFSPIYDLIQRFVNPVFREGHSYEVVKHTLNVDHKIMFAINPDAYLNGSGFGSSFIIELYALGGVFAILIGGMLLGYLINKVEFFLQQRQEIIVFSWFWILYLTWTARGTFILDVIQPILTFTILGILMLIMRYVASQKRRYN